MKYFSMFSGIGGFEIAIEEAYERVHNNKYESEKSNTTVSEQRGVGTAQEQDFKFCSADNATLCVGFSEIDRHAIAVYKHHYGEHKNYGNATTIDAEQLPDFDLLVGGFPCQAFSMAGKRKGFEDTRGTLFYDIARIAKVKRPKYMVLENVKGLLSHDKGKTLATILATIWELGYEYQYGLVNSRYFGVPQNRERIIIVCSLRGTSRPQVFPIDNGAGENTKQVVSTAIDSNYSKGFDKHGQRTGVMIGTYRTFKDKRGFQESKEMVSPSILARAREDGSGQVAVAIPVMSPQRAEKQQNGRRIKENGDPAFTLTGQDQHGVIIEIPKKRIRIHEPKVEQIQPYLRKALEKANITIARIERIFGNRAPHHWFEKVEFASLPSVDDWYKLKEILRFDETYDQIMTEHKLMTDWEIMQEHKERHEVKGNGFGVSVKKANEVGNTLTSFSDRTNAIDTESAIRRLTPIECERLQAFPDNWTQYGNYDGVIKQVSDSQRYKMCGNAVTTKVIAAVMEKIFLHEMNQ